MRDRNIGVNLEGRVAKRIGQVYPHLRNVDRLNYVVIIGRYHNPEKYFPDDVRVIDAPPIDDGVRDPVDSLLLAYRDGKEMRECGTAIAKIYVGSILMSLFDEIKTTRKGVMADLAPLKTSYDDLLTFVDAMGIQPEGLPGYKRAIATFLVYRGVTTMCGHDLKQFTHLADQG